jgi:hypothetical protein
MVGLVRGEFRSLVVEAGWRGSSFANAIVVAQLLGIAQYGIRADPVNARDTDDLATFDMGIGQVVTSPCGTLTSPGRWDQRPDASFCTVHRHRKLLSVKA